MKTATLNWVVADEVSDVSVDTQRQIEAGSLDELIARNQKLDQGKRDFEVPATSIALQPGGDFTITAAGNEKYQLEDWALAQVCGLAGRTYNGSSLPTQYVKSLIGSHPALYSPIWTSHMGAYKKSILVRTHQNQIRGILSDRFSKVDNSDLLSVLNDYLSGPRGGRYNLIRPWIGRDGMHVRLLFRTVLPDNGSDGSYGIGVVVRTGEIGNISASVMPFLQRTSCENSTVWQDGGIKLKQIGSHYSKMVLLSAAIGEALAAAPQMIDRAMKARGEFLPNLTDMLDGLCVKNGWGTDIRDTVLMGIEGQSTVAGLVNGLTYAAHRLNLPATRSLEMEMVGGKVLMTGRA